MTGRWIFAVLVLVVSPAQAQLVLECGELTNAYGPYDYTNYSDLVEKWPIVEAGHFNSNVENLVSGMTGTIMTDLEYALRAFPNHSRVLWSMAQLHIRENTSKLPGGKYSIDCWFDRAIRMNPSNPDARYIYAMYLHRVKQYDNAMTRYMEALELKPDYAEAHYNVALLYLSRDQLDQATMHATKAYQLGFPLPGLQRKLAKRGITLDLSTQTPDQ